MSTIYLNDEQFDQLLEECMVYSCSSTEEVINLKGFSGAWLRFVRSPPKPSRSAAIFHLSRSPGWDE